MHSLLSFNLHNMANMNSYYNGVPHSSTVSEMSSAPPSPLSCTTSAQSATSPAGATRHGSLVPNRVFVGGFASNTTETELHELFSQFGTVKAIKIISDRGGVCKGYGFATFETEEEARKVLHQPDSIVLKERRLNIAPAVMKQQPFGRLYDVAPPTGGLLYHNGTTYTYHNGTAFFTAQSPQSPYSPRDSAMYAAPYGTGAPQYPQIMYTQPYSPPVPYLTGQQYQYHVPYDYFKTVAPTSQYIYAPPGAMNGALGSALNGSLGNSNQSPSPGYPQGSGVTGAEIYYNGINHPAPLPIGPHQPFYPVDSSPEVTPSYSNRQGMPPYPQHQSQQQSHSHQGYLPRRGGGGMRNSGSKTYMGGARNSSSYYNSSGSHTGNQSAGITHNNRAISSKSNSPKMAAESVNGTKSAASSPPAPGATDSTNVSSAPKDKSLIEEGGAGDTATVQHALPMSPPNTPLQEKNDSTSLAGGSDGEVCQKMKALAL